MHIGLIFSAVCIAVIGINHATALQCLASNDVNQANSTELCASFHTGCYEQIGVAQGKQSLEYVASCARGDECNKDKPESCLFCLGVDSCNTGLLKRISENNTQCHSYSGAVKQIFYGSEVELIPQVKELPVFCVAGVNQCHRIKITEPDPEFKTGYSISPNKMSIIGGCGKIDCRELKSVSECLICSGRLCNSLDARGPPIGIEMMSDELTAKMAQVGAVRSDGLLLTAAAAVCVALSRQ